MYYIYNQYDSDKLQERLRSTRELRWNQYKTSIDPQHEADYSEDEKNKLSHFKCCKTKESFADALSVQRLAVSNWENGKTLPSLDNLVNICFVLDCSIDYLLGSVDTPEIEPISKASHYSGISPEIIRYGIEHPEYLDCLNYFMHPDNCSKLFNTITLDAWKRHWINTSLKELDGNLKEKLIVWYDEYTAITPFTEIGKKTYKTFLEEKLPRKVNFLSTLKKDEHIILKKCVKPNTYQNFFNNREFDYASFIHYLVENTFEPLTANAMIELQKSKLANMFTNLFTNYLDAM